VARRFGVMGRPRWFGIRRGDRALPDEPAAGAGGVAHELLE
jgi:hypothetical protein